MYQDIAQLHEEVLEFLLEKRKEIPDLRFITRNDNTFFLSRNRDYLYFSLWDCRISVIMPYDRLFIAIRISTSGDLSLALQKDKTILLDTFMDDIVDKIGKEEFIQEKSITFVTSVKQYGNWREGLNTFLATDKELIDKCLVEQLVFFKTEKFENKIGFISERFEKDLPNLIKQIERYKQDKLNSQTYLPANEDIRLSYLNLTNIGHFENISLDLSKQVTVLIGENGSGKSTILRAVALGITGTDFFDLDKDLQRERSEIFNGFLKINEYQKAIPKYAQEGSIVLSINDKELTLQLSPSKLIATKVEIEEIKMNREIILHEGKYIKTLVLGFSQSEAKKVGKDFYVKGETKPSVTDLFPLISNTGKDAMNDLVEWIYYYVHDRENTEPVDKLFAIFSKIVADNGNNETENDIVSLKRPYKTEGVVGSATGRKDIIVCMPDMPEGINLSLVSQGYKNIFRWVGGILMGVYEYQQNFFPEKSLAEISGIVLIDEIDTYLHPKWQRNILKVLVEEFPKLQFVVTTHSPLVISNLSTMDIEEEEENGNLLKVKGIDFSIYEIAKSDETNEIAAIPFAFNQYYPFASKTTRTLKYMHLMERPEIIRLKFNRLDKYINNLFQDKSLISKAENLIAELKVIIDPFDEDLLRYETLFKNKKSLITK